MSPFVVTTICRAFFGLNFAETVWLVVPFITLTDTIRSGGSLNVRVSFAGRCRTAAALAGLVRSRVAWASAVAAPPRRTAAAAVPQISRRRSIDRPPWSRERGPRVRPERQATSGAGGPREVGRRRSAADCRAYDAGASRVEAPVVAAGSA